MTNPQGTEFETAIVNAATILGIPAGRYPKMASPGEPDVWIGWGMEPTWTGVPVVMWKRLVGKKAEGRRKPDGERVVAVLSGDDFLMLVSQLQAAGLQPRFQVQAKWATALNPTRTLWALRTWLTGRLEKQ